MAKIILTDEELAEQINNYRKNHKAITRLALIKECNTSVVRLEKLAKLGMISALPEPLTRSMAATRARKKSTWGQFKLPGSPTFR